MLEPTVALIGLAILTNLYAYYLDHVLSYSVCFKCAIPFQVPNLAFAGISSMPAELKSLYLFCFYWFGAWGIDHSTGLASISIPDAIGLGLIGFICCTFVGGIAPSITSALTNSAGAGVSAGGMGASAGSRIAGGVRAAAGGSMWLAKKVVPRVARGVRAAAGGVKKGVVKGAGKIRSKYAKRKAAKESQKSQTGKGAETKGGVTDKVVKLPREK